MIDPKYHKIDTEGMAAHFFDIDISELRVEESVEKLKEILVECRGTLELSRDEPLEQPK